MMPPFKKSVIMKDECSQLVGNNNDVHKEMPTYLSACNICGQPHDTYQCPFLLNLHHIKDTPIPSHAKQSLPKDLEITKMADGTMTVIAKCEFQRGTTFGPFQAKKNWALNPMNNFPIKIFGNSSNETFYLDYSDENSSNWMSFIMPASNAKEQNLICYQVKQDIYYTAMRVIPNGEELRVWYAPYYAMKMQMPLHNVDSPEIDNNTQDYKVFASDINIKKEATELLNKDVAQELAERLPAKKLGAINPKENWTCKFCSLDVNSVVSYAKHLMEHYKPLLGAYCNICNKKFYTNADLEKHKEIKHSDEVANAEIGNSTPESQQNGQSLLNLSSDSDGQTSDVVKEIFEKLKMGGKIGNENSLMISDKENQSEISALVDSQINIGNILHNHGNLIENNCLKSVLENQCLNISIGSIADSLLADNISGIDSVKFNVDEFASELSLDISAEIENINRKVAESFDCDICSKKFQRPYYLYRHLRKHTGEFICPECLAVFARKENLMSHQCGEHKVKVNYECPYCQKTFTVKKYLKRHMAIHFKFNQCKWCRNSFTSQSELETHKCVEPKHICSQCNKRFLHAAHLNRHMKLHSQPPKSPIQKKVKKKMPETKQTICEKCGDVFKNPYSLKQHLRSHGEPTYECDVCQRRFHRIGVLKEHKQIHQSAEIPCNVCGKKLKSKKALDVHILLHGNKKFQCEKCDKSFFQRCNYLKHYKQMHTEKIIHKCPECSTEFTSEISFKKHVESHNKNSRFSCATCHKTFLGAYQLKRHIQTTHSGIIYRCPYCSMTARHRHSMRRHFERQHKDFIDEWNKPGFVNQLTEKSAACDVKNDDNTNNNNTNENNNQEIMLSISAACDTFTKPSEGQVDRINQVDGIIADNQMTDSSSLTTTQMLLESSKISGQSPIENSEISLSEVPQLSIVDTDTQLTDSVLSNAYIFGEDGDIMFYVLGNNPVISEY